MTSARLQRYSKDWFELIDSKELVAGGGGIVIPPGGNENLPGGGGNLIVDPETGESNVTDENGDKVDFPLAILWDVTNGIENMGVKKYYIKLESKVIRDAFNILLYYVGNDAHGEYVLTKYQTIYLTNPDDNDANYDALEWQEDASGFIHPLHKTFSGWANVSFDSKTSQLCIETNPVFRYTAVYDTGDVNEMFWLDGYSNDWSVPDNGLDTPKQAIDECNFQVVLGGVF